MHTPQDRANYLKSLAKDSSFDPKKHVHFLEEQAKDPRSRTWPMPPKTCLTGQSKENESFCSFRAMPRKVRLTDSVALQNWSASLPASQGGCRHCSQRIHLARRASPDESDSPLIEMAGNGNCSHDPDRVFSPASGLRFGCRIFYTPRPRARRPSRFLPALGPTAGKSPHDRNSAQQYFDQGLAFLYGFNTTPPAVVRSGREMRSRLRDGLLGDREWPSGTMFDDSMDRGAAR